LLQHRRDEEYANSLKWQHRHADSLQQIAAGDVVIDDLESGYAVDVPNVVFTRDYEPLVRAGLFEATPLGERVTTVRATASAEEDASRARALLAATPFHQKLERISEQLSQLVATKPPIGRHQLSERLDVDNEIDQEIIRVLGQKEGITVQNGSIEISIRDEVDDEATRFIYTQTAQTLLEELEATGYHLSKAAEQEIITEDDSRYGSPYAWMSRELMRSVAENESRLFEATNPDSQPSYTDDAGANVLIDIIRQLHERGDGPHPSDLPVVSERVSLRDKGCKDVEEYFSQSAALPDALAVVQINNKNFWHKTHGGHTFINLEEIVYNGVELPPGYLFRKDGEGYTLLRATGFVFDKSTADQLFGAPMTENYAVHGGEAAMQRAFDLFATQRK
jgi:hypothetical protein